MDNVRLVSALSTYITLDLAEQLVDHFLKIRQDAATGVLERSSPGKFVETLVQVLQHLSGQRVEEKPNVDEYLRDKVENAVALPEGLRICASRVGRSVYTFRNKRNMVHVNPIDPNRYDLSYCHHAAAWTMAELLRNATGVSMHEAGALIELLQAPVGALVEEIEGIRLLHLSTSVRGEILVLLHSHYPERVPKAAILASLHNRSGGSVGNRLGEMKAENLVFGDAVGGFRLTQSGFRAALIEIAAALST